MNICSVEVTGWGRVVESGDAADGAILFYGAYKPPEGGGGGPVADTFDLIRLFDAEGSHR